jgi:hypothetical protein
MPLFPGDNGLFLPFLLREIAFWITIKAPSSGARRLRRRTPCQFIPYDDILRLGRVRRRRQMNEVGKTERGRRTIRHAHRALNLALVLGTQPRLILIGERCDLFRKVDLHGIRKATVARLKPA